MSDTPFEIKDDEINAEEIMEKIRRRRKEAEIHLPDPAGLPSEPDGSNAEIARDLAYLSCNWNIQNNSHTFISSHRHVTRKFLTKGRDLVHGEVGCYVDLVMWKQAPFIGKSFPFNITGPEEAAGIVVLFNQWYLPREGNYGQ